MKNLPFLALSAVALMLAAALLTAEAVVLSEAQKAVVTCNPTELMFQCLKKKIYRPPSRQCCSKLKEQKPCLCGYIHDPDIGQFFDNPYARYYVAPKCGVPYPPSDC